MNRFYSGIFTGWLIMMAIQSIHQDILGKEAYIATVRAHWVSEWVTIPLALIMLFFAFILCWADEKEYGEKEGGICKEQKGGES